MIFAIHGSQHCREHLYDMTGIRSVLHFVYVCLFLWELKDVIMMLCFSIHGSCLCTMAVDVRDREKNNFFFVMELRLGFGHRQ